MSCEVFLAEADFDPAESLREFSRRAEGCGAIASFTGVTRAKSKAGQGVSGLFLDHHPRLTLLSMCEIVEATKARFWVSHTRIIHRCGLVAAGDPIVFVAAASGHRRAALEAVDYMMDRLKTDAMFWKREDHGDAQGGDWIEPTEADYRDRKRWQ